MIVAHFRLQHEKMRQLEYEKAHTLKLMLEKERRYVESLRSKLAKNKDPGTESIIQQDLLGAERRVQTLQQQLEQEVEFLHIYSNTDFPFFMLYSY